MRDPSIASPATSRAAAPAPTAPRFAHVDPPFARRLAYGAWICGLVAPAVWTLERLGGARWALGHAFKRRQRALRRLDPFRGYVPGPQDVFVATYPKSGTNWMLQIVHQLAHHGAGAYAHLHDVVPWPETRVLPRVFRDYAVPLEHADAWRDAPERLRAIKTHLNWEFLPPSDVARYVMVVRDPKDVFVSSYHFFRDGVLGPAMPSVRTWYELFLRGRTLAGSWAVNAASCWARRSLPNVLLLSFSSLKRDLPGTVRRVAEFLGVSVSERVLASVVEQASFAHMKRLDEKFRIGRVFPWRAPGAMLRKGAEGGSSELLTIEQQRRMDETFVAELRRLGSSFPYDEFARRA